MSEAAIKTDVWRWWRDALAGNPAPIDVNFPEQGYYRAKQTDGAYVPVAYWWAGDTLKCLWRDKMLDEEVALERWPFISKHPISEETYNLVMDGGQWPDLDATVAAQLDESRHGIGGNNPPRSPEDELKEFIENAIKTADQYANIESDELAAIAQSARSRLLELSGKAEKARVAAIGDHYRLYKEAHEKWKPLVDTAKSAADKIRGFLTAWERRKARKAAEEQAAAEAAARVAADEAQRAADAAIAQGIPPSAQEAPQDTESGGFAGGAPPTVPAATPVAPLPKTQIRGGYGRAASVTMVKVPTIVDQDKVYAAFRTHDEVKKALMICVKRAINAGQTVPGVTVAEEPDVR